MNKIFKVNEAGWDRIARIVLGLALLGLGLTGVIPGVLGIVAGIAGLVFVATGLIGWCPLYAPFGFSTKKS